MWNPRRDGGREGGRGRGGREGGTEGEGRERDDSTAGKGSNRVNMV